MGFVHCDHEYLNFKGTKLSKSRGAFVEVPYFLSKYDPDALRFYLTATLPETRYTKACPEGIEGFSWEDFVEMLVLLAILRGRQQELVGRQMAGSLARNSFAAVVMGGVSGSIASLLANGPALLAVGVAVSAGVAVYVAISLALGAEEPQALRPLVRQSRPWP